jgi:integrase
MTVSRQKRQSFGAIRQRSSGRYQASYVGLDGNRYNAPHTFDTKTDARGWLSVQQAKLHIGTWSAMDAARVDTAKASKSITLGDYATDWLATRLSRNGEPLRPRTRVEYARLLHTTLTPLAGERIVALTPAMIRLWHSNLMATGKRTQASRAYGFLKSVLGTAVEDGRIIVNPCMIRGAQNAVTGRKVEPPTADELRKILDTIAPRYKAAVIIAAWAGARYGEMTELRRRDIVITDDAVVVNIDRAVTMTTGEGFIVGKTKSEAGVRSVVVPPHVQEMVVKHLAAYVGDSPDALLFPGGDGQKHLTLSTFQKHWYRARKAAGREDMPWHALRHHGATRAALAGATLKELQDRLGHSTVAAAMRYQHTAGRDAELAKRMSELAES